MEWIDGLTDGMGWDTFDFMDKWSLGSGLFFFSSTSHFQECTKRIPCFIFGLIHEKKKVDMMIPWF